MGQISVSSQWPLNDLLVWQIVDFYGSLITPQPIIIFRKLRWGGFNNDCVSKWHRSFFGNSSQTKYNVFANSSMQICSHTPVSSSYIHLTLFLVPPHPTSKFQFYLVVRFCYSSVCLFLQLQDDCVLWIQEVYSSLNVSISRKTASFFMWKEVCSKSGCVK